MKTRVVLRLKGGIGNQLYCLAFAISILKRNNIVVVFDCFSGFLLDSFNRRPYLDKLFIERIVRKSGFFDILTGYIKRTALKFFNDSKISYLIESPKFPISFTYFLKKNKFVHIEGYWQNVIYGNDVISLMLEAYIPPQIDDSLKSIFEELLCGEATITHVRAIGIDCPTAAKYFSGPTYSDFIGKRKRNYYISDSKYPLIYMEKNGLIRLVSNSVHPELTEFELLRVAKVKCLANSTFSYWAAKLSPSPSIIIWQD
jgi:hypothetical protein